MPTETPMTFREFETLAEEGGIRHEFDEGRVVELSPTKLKHDLFRRKIAAMLANCLPRLVVVEEFTIRPRSDVLRIPDITVYHPSDLEQTDAEGYLKAVPLVALEVLSPGDRMVEVKRKVKQLLSVGAGQVIVVDPEERDVTVYEHDELHPVVWTSGSVRILDICDLSVNDLW